MKKLMILGGGPNQLPLIKAAKKNGYCVALCDCSENAPGVELADEFYLVSIMDKEAVFEATKAAKADGIISNSEPAMPIVAYVGNALGLPSNDYELISSMTDKFRFRTLLKENGFSVPGFGSAETYEEAKRLFGNLNKPLMIKPAESSGSRGVAKLEDNNNLKACFDDAKSFSRNGMVILEEYIANTCEHIVGGDIFVCNGQVIFWGLMSCIRNECSPLEPMGKAFPAILTEEQAGLIKAEISNVVRKLGIKFSTINVEAMINKRGEVCFIELNPRNGGNYIPDALKSATGFDVFNATVRAAVGENVDPDHGEQCIPYITYQVNGKESGTLKSVCFSDDIRAFIEAYLPDIDVGEPVEPFINADKRLGVLMLKFDSIEQRDKILEDIEDHIFVEVE